MNVYLIEDDGGGVTVFDAGVKSMVNAVAAAGSGLGGINRVVLGHGHRRTTAASRRGWAPPSSATRPTGPTQGDGGRHYFDFAKLRPYARPVFPHLLDLWDGGPVTIAGTVEEGEDVSGFRAVHLPGHAPGLIALYRERDGVALTSDCFYTLDPQTGIHGPPRVPHPAFNLDTEQARASIRKLAELTPSARGRATPSRSPATSPPSSSAPPRRPDGQAQPPSRRAGRARRAGVGVPQPGRRRARAARRDVARHAARVRGGRGRLAALARGRLAARAEFLFERLAVRWEIAGAEPLTRQKELLGRYRFASPDERRWIRDVLREHLAEHFPELDAP